MRRQYIGLNILFVQQGWESTSLPQQRCEATAHQCDVPEAKQGAVSSLSAAGVSSSSITVSAPSLSLHTRADTPVARLKLCGDH